MSVEQAPNVGPALTASAWLMWRDVLFGALREEIDMDEKAQELFTWICGHEEPPLDYCVCYEQVCDFSAAVGRHGDAAAMRDIVTKIESADTAETYEQRIRGLLQRHDSEDTQAARQAAERMYAATHCLDTYQRRLMEAIVGKMASGEPLVNKEDTKSLSALVELYSQVSEHALQHTAPRSAAERPPRNEDGSKGAAWASDGAVPALDEGEGKKLFRRNEMRRKSTRRNLSTLEEQMILMRKKEAELQLCKKKNKKGGRRQRVKKQSKKKNGTGASSADGERVAGEGAEDGSLTSPRPSSKLNWARTRFGSISKGHKGSHSRPRTEGTGDETSSLSFNLSDGAIDYQKQKQDAQQQQQRQEETRSSHSSEQEASSQEARDETFYRYLARHFVAQAWSHLNEHGACQGVSEFLANYKFPNYTLSGSKEMRVDVVCDALGDLGKLNFVRHIVQRACEPDAVNERIANVREKVAGSNRAWSADCDYHAHLAALFSYAGDLLYQKYGYFARVNVDALNSIGDNEQMKQLNSAMKHAYAEYDESLLDLHAVYTSGPRADRTEKEDSGGAGFTQ